MSRPISQQVVLVTGAARGIGAETARRLAAKGARLALLGLEPERLAALATELGEAHRAFPCDVTDQASMERAVADAMAHFGGIDVVLANAGIASNGTVAVTPMAALARTVDVNLTGVIRTVHVTLPHVLARRGYFLLVSSAAAIAPLGGLATYAATKSGVEAFGNALRLELAHQGVQVGTAHPSWIDTDMVRDQQKDLPTFSRVLATLPRPFGGVTSVAVCADAFVDGIARRARKVFVPGSLAPLAAIRQLFASPLAEAMTRRQSRQLLPALEREVRRLGRAFGENSVGLGERHD